jgi:hypothetical protein
MRLPGDRAAWRSAGVSGSWGRAAALVALPTALAVAFALVNFWPPRDAVFGWGDDPLFNLWTLELVWRRLSTLGPLRIFSGAFWQAPLFGDAPLGLAFSENQLYAALLLWALRALCGNGALTMGVGAVASILAAHFCAASFLRSAGVHALRFWGGLVFAACGWLQTEYAHYQNLCIFLLPLSLRAFAAFEARPTALRLLLCALAFGWISGWNLYFQLFANACLLVLVVRARRRVPLPRLAALVTLTLAVQWPIASKYLELGRRLGGYRVLVTYGASLRSLLATDRARLVFSSLDSAGAQAGYLGLVWIALMLLSLRRPAARPWLAACAVAFWVSLGYGAGLFELLSLLPGVSGLRAIGRAQVLVVLFSLPAVLGTLEALPPVRAALLLGLALLELTPGALPLRVPVDPALFGAPTPLARALADGDDPVLVLPEVSGRTMLAMGAVPYFGGYSGRAPPGEELLQAITVRRGWSDGSLDAALDLARPRRVLALTAALSGELRASPRLRLRGCYAGFDGKTPCLFEARSPNAAPAPAAAPALAVPGAASLRLDRDARWEASAGLRGPVLDLRATAPGALDIREVDRCHLRQTLRFPWLPSFAHDLPLQGSELRGARFAPGDLLLHRELAQAVFRLPSRLRPAARLSVVCLP